MSRDGASQTGRIHRGFSLLELVMVVAILGVLAAIAAPRYGRATARYRADVAARRIAVDIGLARRSARTSGAARTIEFSAGPSQYTIAGLAGLTNPAADYRVDLSAAPYEARILSVDFGGDAKLTFDGYGAPDSGGSVRVQVGEAVKAVVLNPDTHEAKVE